MEDINDIKSLLDELNRLRAENATLKALVAKASNKTSAGGHPSNLNAETALKESEERYRKLFENAPVGLGMADIQGNLLAFNDEMMRPGGYTREDIKKIGSVAALYADPKERDRVLALARKQGFVRREEVHFKRKDGSVYTALLTLEPVMLDGRPGWQAMSEDVTERRQLEAQVLQAQKMESIGRVAGGVAHDFNNLLTGILGYVEMLAHKLPPDMQSELSGIREISLRGASLTRQLLGFARKQPMQAKVVNVSGLIANTSSMLQRLIGENIELSVESTPEPLYITIDPAQFEQILMNLAVNARDAMPEGGKILIRTESVELDEAGASAREVSPGGYAYVSVSDNGIGITDDVRKHLFEPFFTTKEFGKGTGLGLATCYGIVKQHRGQIWVEDAAGRGATFKFILPRVGTPPEPEPKRVSAALPVGDECILLVEDEPTVRSAAATALRMAGFDVLEASDGKHAMQVLDDARKTIDLLVSDVVMPRMGGQELAQALYTRDNRLRILFMSGYTREELLPRGIPTHHYDFQQKPFLPETLARKSREILDRRTKE